VRRAAAAASPDDPAAGDRAAADPEAWWAEHGDGQDLGYSNLLAAIAPTQAARRDAEAGSRSQQALDMLASWTATPDPLERRPLGEVRDH
jgi:hypothetical protein